MWKESLNKIRDDEKEYGDDLNAGASKEDIKKLAEEAKEQLNKDLPQEYLNAIETVNGIEYNGFILYGTDEYLSEQEYEQPIIGLIDSNQVWYENEDQKKYLFLGESSISWYVYENETNKFIELDNPSGRELYTYNSFDEMFNKMLKDSLNSDNPQSYPIHP